MKSNKKESIWPSHLDKPDFSDGSPEFLGLSFVILCLLNVFYSIYCGNIYILTANIVFLIAILLIDSSSNNIIFDDNLDKEIINQAYKDKKIQHLICIFLYLTCVMFTGNFIFDLLNIFFILTTLPSLMRRESND